jgi:hypothetical protein
MYEKLSKRALKNMYMAAGFTALIYLVIAIVVELAIFIPEKITMGTIILSIVSLLVLINLLVSPVFRYHRYRYKIDNECIDIIEGYLFVTRNIVPIERLHKLQILSGPFDKICGVAKVIVTTAGGDVTIRFLDVEKAEAITENLKVKINDIVMEQKEAEEAKTQLTEDMPKEQ